MAAPRVLLLTQRLKEYWASPYGRSRTTRVLTAGEVRLPARLRGQRRLGQLALAIQALQAAPAHDVVVCVDRFLAQAFGALKQLAGLTVPVIAHQFILPDSDDSGRRPLADLWDRVSCRGLSRIIVNASHEVEAYARRLEAPGRVVFIPLAVDPQAFEVRAPAAPAPGLFSGGVAQRDYPTLFRAVRGMPLPVEVVVYSRETLEGAAPPENVRVRYGLPFHDFLQAMAGAQLVIVPLHPTKRSAGQGTIAFAQAMGKAVIASDVVGVHDYIAHGVNGWLVRPEDPDRLRQAIEHLLADAALRGQLERAARAHALASYSYAGYDRCMETIIADAGTAQGGR